MSLRRRLFLTLCVIVLLGFLGIARWIRGELRTSYSQVVEESLVDASALLASIVEVNGLQEPTYEMLTRAFVSYKKRRFRAPIFEFMKIETAFDLYVTDAKGRVVFSSKPGETGNDFSAWNDVVKTLRGEYGARSTRIDKSDSRTSVYYVAAPVHDATGKIEGVVTISKTESSILLFLDRALDQMFAGAFFAVVALGLIGGLIMIWIALPLERLRRYALAVSEGERVTLPVSDIKDVRQLTDAFEKMRIALEGKKANERYTQTLTHELKSPLTAIKGAAELCMEEMDSSQRDRFLSNIVSEADRSHMILESLLQVSALETKRSLDSREPVSLGSVMEETMAALSGHWQARGVKLTLAAPKTPVKTVDFPHGSSQWKDADREVTFGASDVISGDRFLLMQAFRNVLSNAIDFSSEGDTVAVEIEAPPAANLGQAPQVVISFHDQGTGIPEFAKNRIFEKFYSLERPGTKRKSSGLGLSIVKEVVDLHGGSLEVISPGRDGRGTTVRIVLPATRSAR